MTDAVKRYYTELIGDGLGTLPEGEYVLATDYDALQQQLEQAQGWNDELRTQLREIRAQQLKPYPSNADATRQEDSPTQGEKE